MTRDEAEAEAAKRERHKSKHMTNKRWAAVNWDGEWKVRLIDNHVEPPRREAPSEGGINLFDVMVVTCILARGVSKSLASEKPKEGE